MEPGGSMYELAAELWGVRTRGREFLELRRRLFEAFAIEVARVERVPDLDRRFGRSAPSAKRGCRCGTAGPLGRASETLAPSRSRVDKLSPDRVRVTPTGTSPSNDEHAAAVLTQRVFAFFGDE
jgi:hypothetical protein